MDNSVDGSSASVAANLSSSSNVRSSSKSLTIISTDGSNSESALLVLLDVRCDVDDDEDGELADAVWTTAAETDAAAVDDD